MPDAAADAPRDLLAGLNEPQREAVMHGEGPLLILAGAGSGKTRVLTHRIAYLVAHRAGARRARSSRSRSPTRPRRRCASASSCCVGRARAAMWVMTFHSACARMLRAEAHAARLHAPVHDLRPGRLAPARQALHRRARRRPQALHAAARSSARSRDAKNKLRRRRGLPRSSSARYFEQTVADVYELYERELHRMNAMDFDDLLVPHGQRARALPGGPRALPASAFRHVLVDEYQDTNHAQYRWLAAARRRAPQPRVVGDDDQSIYCFRGADIRNILDFEDDFPDAARGQARAELPLDADDPRRGQRGDRATTAAQMAKTLWTDVGQGDPIQVRELDDEHAEARFVAGEIERLVDEGGVARRRSPSSTAPTRSRACSRTRSCAREIAYQVIGGTKFYERAEIKDAIAYLTLLGNPQDVVAFTRIANSPRRGHRPDLARRA